LIQQKDIQVDGISKSAIEEKQCHFGDLNELQRSYSIIRKVFSPHRLQKKRQRVAEEILAFWKSCQFRRFKVENSLWTILNLLPSTTRDHFPGARKFPRVFTCDDWILRKGGRSQREQRNSVSAGGFPERTMLVADRHVDIPGTNIRKP
jgi:hypothetical protein